MNSRHVADCSEVCQPGKPPIRGIPPIRVAISPGWAEVERIGKRLDDPSWPSESEKAYAAYALLLARVSRQATLPLGAM